MDEFERAYQAFAQGKSIKPKRLVCAHTETRPNGIGFTACTTCGARFAVIYA